MGRPPGPGSCASVEVLGDFWETGRAEADSAPRQASLLHRPDRKQRGGSMASATPVWRGLLNGWMVIAGRFGFVQTLLLLVLFYVVLIGPARIATALGRRDLLAKR